MSPATNDCVSIIFQSEPVSDSKINSQWQLTDSPETQGDTQLTGTEITTYFLYSLKTYSLSFCER